MQTGIEHTCECGDIKVNVAIPEGEEHFEMGTVGNMSAWAIKTYNFSYLVENGYREARPWEARGVEHRPDGCRKADVIVLEQRQKRFEQRKKKGV
jgi:hypothetical protein